jgi:hypothetical protein
MRRTAFVFLLATLLAGCAAQPKPLSREEFLAATTRTYEGKSKEQVIAAAERVLKLADGDDFAFAHNERGFDAVREWSAFALIIFMTGRDYWTFHVAEQPEGIKASVQVSVFAEGLTPTPTTAGGWVATSSPVAGTGRPVDGPALYELFWTRMDHLLGLRERWMDCKEADALRDAGTTWGNNSPLCNAFNITDLAPSGTTKQ